MEIDFFTQRTDKQSTVITKGNTHCSYFFRTGRWKILERQT